MHRRFLLFGALAGLALASSLVTSAETNVTAGADVQGRYTFVGVGLHAPTGDIFELHRLPHDGDEMVFAAMQPENHAGTKIDQRAATAGRPGDLKAARPSSDAGREVPAGRVIDARKQSWHAVPSAVPPRPS